MPGYNKLPSLVQYFKGYIYIHNFEISKKLFTIFM
jgi:hypothetical protein